MKTKFFNLALAAVIAVAIAGCGGKEKTETNEQPVKSSNATKVVDTSTAGSVTGTVTLDGKPAAGQANQHERRALLPESSSEPGRAARSHRKRQRRSR